jgi:hypothetical protein
VKVGILETAKTAPPCTYEVPSNVAFSHEAESEVIRVTYHPMVCASLNWTVANPNPWITVRETVRRESSGQCKLTVAPNPGGAGRKATITVAGP